MTKEAKNLASWIFSSLDHRQLPFIAHDKRATKVFVLLADGSPHDQQQKFLERLQATILHPVPGRINSLTLAL
jgi:hypothetical protein